MPYIHRDMESKLLLCPRLAMSAIDKDTLLIPIWLI